MSPGFASDQQAADKTVRQCTAPCFARAVVAPTLSAWLLRCSVLTRNGMCRLVGVAWTQPSGSKALDTFLRLPADTLAVMKCRFIFPHELSPAVGSLKTA